MLEKNILLKRFQVLQKHRIYKKNVERASKTENNQENLATI